jgi:hypothetical protein
MVSSHSTGYRTQSHYSIQCVKSLYSTVKWVTLQHCSKSLYSTVTIPTTPCTVIQVTLQHIQYDNSLYRSVKLLYSIHNASSHSTAQGVHHPTAYKVHLLYSSVPDHYSIHSARSHHTTNTILLPCYEGIWTWSCVPSRMTKQWLEGSIRYWIA